VVERFLIKVFYPDGGPPESGTQEITDLSGQWMSVCSDFLEYHGPVMTHNMGGTLSHFDIHMGGPVGQLYAYGRPCFEFAISRGTEWGQDQGAVDHFVAIIQSAESESEQTVTYDVVSSAREAALFPTLLIFDRCDPEVPDEQKGALMQLGYHLAGAYLKYIESQNADS
jgi:hypothetical protein